MKIFYYLATILIGGLGVSALFFNYTELTKNWKIGLGVAALILIVFCLAYEQIEKIKEKIGSERSDIIASYEREGILNKIDDLKIKEKKGLMSESDYLRYVSLYLEKIDLNFSQLNLKFQKSFILDYFDDIRKIPDYFNFEEWKESEVIIYQKTIDRIQGDFNSRGMIDSGMYPVALEEVKKEREKAIKAKEREFSTKAKLD